MRLALIRPNVAIVSLLVLTATLTGAGVASAQVVSDKSSNATAPLVWSTRDNFYGAGADLSNSKVDVKVGFSFNAESDPTKDLLRVDMSKGALIGASWGDGKTMTISSTGSNNKEGFLRAEYQIAPTVDLTVDASSIPLIGNVYSFNWNANDLLNQLNGANFQYHAANQANFEPWGWQGAQFTIPGASIDNSKLIGVSFDQLIGASSPLVGDISINMTTTPTFTYKTTAITLDKNSPILKDGEEVEYKAVDTDFMEIEALVVGQIDYVGTMNVHPTVTVTGINVPSLGQVPVDISFDIDSVGKEFDYSSAVAPGAPIKVEFPPTKFHIPLPNVKVASRSLDMGSATLGEQVKKTVTIENTGEMGAVLGFESSDPQFTVTKATKIAAKSKFELEVTFTPNNAGAAAATVTAKTNDPNEPTIQLKLTANGAEPVEPPAATAPPVASNPVGQPGSDGGCGCVTAGSSTPQNSGLGLGVVALGLAAFVNRRRSRR